MHLFYLCKEAWLQTSVRLLQEGQSKQYVQKDQVGMRLNATEVTNWSHPSYHNLPFGKKKKKTSERGRKKLIEEKRLTGK